MNLILVLGNQLFDPVLLKNQPDFDAAESVIFMREDAELCTHYQYHKHKIILFLSAMRTYRSELEAQGIKVHYEEIADKPTAYEDSLLAFIKKQKIKRVSFYEIEDKFFETRIVGLLAENKIPFEVWDSPMFITPRNIFKSYLADSPRPFMKVFTSGNGYDLMF